MTNKGERNRKTKIKFLNRLRKMGILEKSGEPTEKQYCYKNQGKNCSCHACSHEKYNRNVKHKKKKEDISEDE